jgi:dolichol kinase
LNTAAIATVFSPPEPRRLADRIFRIAVAVNLALTAFALLAAFTGFGSGIAGKFEFNGQSAFRILFAAVFFNGIWALIWYGVKNLLLAKFVHMSREDRRAVFSSRMSQPFDLAGLLARYSERRIRIVDMIGRRGRFITFAMALLYFLYANIAANKSGNFASAFTGETLLDGVIMNWLCIALFYLNGFVARLFFGAQTRIMDGALARANFLTILTLWALFKFTLIPIGAQLQTLYPPEHFAILFVLIWGTYFIVDTMAEVGGSLYGNQKIKVRGVGETNRKSIGGTVTGLVSGLAFALAVVVGHGLPAAFIAMAILLAVASSALELLSPRGTDDFTMATGNALIVWAFGAWVI